MTRLAPQHSPTRPRPRGKRGGVRAVAAVLTLAALVGLGLTVAPRPAVAQAENLINRISNERMARYEEKLTADLDASLARYLARRQYVLAVKVVWNPEVVPVIENPELTPEQQKLPGFPIFVRSPDSPAAEEGTPPFVRLEVRVLIDETLPEYYERFVRKLVPIVARMDFNRGDQVVVLKETFPVKTEADEPPPTLSEQELMEELGEAPPPGQQPPVRPQQFPTQPGVMAPQMAPQFAPSAPAYSPQTATSPAEAVQMAYDEGRYRDALRIVQGAFQRATTNRERGFYLGMEGSIHYTLGNTEAARAAWRRAVTYDPSNMEVHEVLNYLETPPGGSAP